MLLVVDIGNTHTHLGLCLEGKIEKAWDIPTSAKGGPQGLLVAVQAGIPWRSGRRIEEVAIASVVPSMDALWWNVLEKRFRLRPVWVTAKLPLGIRIDYKPVSAVGADRIANAVGGFKKYGGPLIILDFGTAVTFDVVDAEGNYLGGVIAPGIGLSARALHEGTALLPEIKIKDPVVWPAAVLGQETSAAIRTGLFVGACGMVKEIVEQLKRELNFGAEVHIVATGGYAETMAKQIPIIAHVNPLLTLEGLCEIHARVSGTREAKEG